MDLREYVDQLKDALDKQNLSGIGRLIRTYKGIDRQLTDTIDALLLELSDIANPTAADVRKLTRYKRLMGTLTEELERYTVVLQNELTVQQADGIIAGAKDSLNLTSYALVETVDKKIVASLKRVPDEALEKLIDYVGKDKPLYSRLQKMTPGVVDGVSKAIIEGVTIGRNPVAIGRTINKAFGMGLTDSIRMMRTVQIYSYREASRASYIANSNVVDGWVWFARLDGAVCLSCIDQHGSFHPLSETLNDHHNGRCVMVPKTIINPAPVGQNGEDWFRAQPEGFQKQLMGADRFEAWQDNQFNFSDLSGIHKDDVFGDMRVEMSLKSLIGGSN